MGDRSEDPSQHERMFYQGAKSRSSQDKAATLITGYVTTTYTIYDIGLLIFNNNNNNNTTKINDIDEYKYGDNK